MGQGKLEKAGYLQTCFLGAVVGEGDPADFGIIFRGNDNFRLGINIRRLPEIAGPVLKKADSVKIRLVAKRSQGCRPHLIGIKALYKDKGSVFVAGIFPPAADLDLFIAAVTAAAVGKQDCIVAVRQQVAIWGRPLRQAETAHHFSFFIRPVL